MHALGSGAGFEKTDREAAHTFADGAAAAGVRRIVYLGGLAPAGVPVGDLSPHLRSRAEVGRIFLAGDVPAAVLRAAVVIGSGSASFEMLRYLTERLPVMVTPQLGRHPDPAHRHPRRAALPGRERRHAGGRQPGLRHRRPRHDDLRAMMERYAVIAGLPQRLDRARARALPPAVQPLDRPGHPRPRRHRPPPRESLRHEVVCGEHDITRYVPDEPGAPLGFDQALELALRRVREAEVATRWSTPPCPASPATRCPPTPTGRAAASTPTSAAPVNAPSDTLWRVVEGIGGEHGWYSFPLAWAVRGWLDRLMGGVGLGRGRRDAHRLRVGDSLDFWRVEEVVPGRLLRLRAEMRLPGLAWLEMRTEPDGHGRSRYRQKAVFHPRGLLGHAYWWSVSPFHAVVFGGMARNVAKAAEADPGAASGTG